MITLDAANELLVTNGGRVDATTFIEGPGGNIDATAGRWIRVEGDESGISSRTGGPGVGGKITLKAPRIEIRDVNAAAGFGGVSAESSPGLGPLEEIFDPEGPFEGVIGSVPGPTEVSDAGSIVLTATKLVHLDDGAVTTSVGVAHGGTITIDPEFVILEHGSRITSEATRGSGGQITIIADNYFAFPGSEVSVEAGNPDLSGTIELHAPDVDLAGNLTELPNSYLDAASLMRERCAARRSGEASGSFAVRGIGGIPPEPDGWLRASVEADADATAEVAPALPILAASLSGPLLAAETCE